MKKCDVIIPIYNAYDYVIKCVDSVIKNTVFDCSKLILIDDKSPDDRIWPLLQKYAKKYDFIESYQNDVNKGFVATVNRGMQISKNDVLLLNSDTEVTKNWLSKLIDCAYSKNNVATVTPLSNNATLASVPDYFVPNDIPDGYTLDEMANLVEKCSKNVFPEIPTGHGFCLYIKREVLDEVGLFDAETYGKGYGEENDFCFRCLDHGYRHLLCDNTYIYHKESQSFSESKIELQKNAGKLLRNRYPVYCDRLDYWCQVKPLSFIAENIKLNLSNIKKRNNILCVIHDWNLNHLGGTTMHLFDLISGLRKKHNFHVLTNDGGVYRLYSYWENYETVLTYGATQEFHLHRFFNDDYKNMVERIVNNFNINEVHIHHMMNHYFDIVDVIKNHKLKTIISLHDYYSVCPLITKLYENKTYCGDFKVEKCNACLNNVLKYDNNSIYNWHAAWNKLFQVADEIICPSENCRKGILNVYEHLNITVIEHGTDCEFIDTKYKPTVNSKPFNVAFVGAIGIHKGRDIFLNMLSNCKNKSIKYHLFGILDGHLPKSNKYFINHGSYDRKDICNLLKENEIDLVCLLSICPETFSYTLSEVALCDIPVITLDIGALADRVRKDNLGWVLPLDSDYKLVYQTILDIKNDPTKYNKVQKSVSKYHVKTVDEMCKEYDVIYNKFSNETLLSEQQILNIIDDFKLSKNINPVNNVYNYAWVFDTLKWRIISKFKVPKFVKKAYHKVRGNK